MPSDDDLIYEAASMLRGCRDLLVFSGAGVSAESGVPTFRGSGGVWERYDPSLYGNLPGLTLVFLFRKQRIVSFAAEALRAFVDAVPNAAHEAIAALEGLVPVSGVVTQNVDDLHSVAGSSRVLELHGNAFRLRCSRCGKRREADRETLREVLVRLESENPGRRQLLSSLSEYSGRCDCGGRNRPDVVFFGEGLPQATLDEALELAGRCDCLLAVGTTALVYPAASVPVLSISSGAQFIEVNPTPTRLTPHAHVSIQMSAGEALPVLLEAVSG